ncbi:MAG: hypothetical protein ACR5KV_06405 [Wolbachia sp.]
MAFRVMDCISSVLFLQKGLQAAISFSKMKIVMATFFFEIYNDPTIGLKDKILFFYILNILYPITILYCASKISEFSRILSNSRALSLRICSVLINTILLIPVALLELIKYPLIRLSRLWV